MKSVHLVCRTCGRESTIKVVTPEDLQRRRIPTQPASCPHCGSRNVELHG